MQANFWCLLGWVRIDQQFWYEPTQTGYETTMSKKVYETIGYGFFFFFFNLINIYRRNICTELNLHFITLLTLLDITLLITLLYLMD